MDARKSQNNGLSLTALDVMRVFFISDVFFPLSAPDLFLLAAAKTSLIDWSTVAPPAEHKQKFNQNSVPGRPVDLILFHAALASTATLMPTVTATQASTRSRTAVSRF